MLEPAAGGVHAAAKAAAGGALDGGVVLVHGAGTMGLATIAAVRHYTNPATIIARNIDRRDAAPGQGPARWHARQAQHRPHRTVAS